MATLTVSEFKSADIFVAQQFIVDLNRNFGLLFWAVFLFTLSKQLVWPEIILRQLKLFWAATRENNLILTFDLRYQLDEKPNQFDSIISPTNSAAFESFRLTTKELIVTGIFDGE